MSLLIIVPYLQLQGLLAEVSKACAARLPLRGQTIPLNKHGLGPPLCGFDCWVVIPLAVHIGHEWPKALGIPCEYKHKQQRCHTKKAAAAQLQLWDWYQQLGTACARDCLAYRGATFSSCVGLALVWLDRCYAMMLTKLVSVLSSVIHCPEGWLVHLQVGV